jgi:MYXO-CTERM domain-containing protein
MMKWLSLSFGVLVMAVAGCVGQPPGGERVAGRSEPIIDGETVPAGEEEAVVVIASRRSGGLSLCTGSLIAPRVVLTAKHCVQEGGASEPLPASSFVVGVGSSVRQASQTFMVQSISTSPGTYPDTGGRLAPELVGTDIATITLTTGAAVEPLEVRRESPGALRNTQAKAVGFGQTPDGTTGRKLRTMTSVAGFQGDGDRGVILTPPAVCQGDSGGPLLSQNGKVFGVASGGGACRTGSSCDPSSLRGCNIYNRVDLFLDLIDQALGEAGSCLDNGEEVCDGFDNDCDDQVDENCNDIGEMCESVDECVGGEEGNAVCSDTDAGKICTQPCDPLTPEVGCPMGMYCSRTDGCDGRCVPGSPGDKGNAEPCESDTECASLFCEDPGDGQKRCLTPCKGDQGMCLRGEVCAAVPGACGGCVPADIVAGARGLGEPCTADGDCGSGQCFTDKGVDPETGSYCTRSCESDDGCPDNFHCRVREGGGLCIRGPRPVADAASEETAVAAGCVYNEDCGPGGFCASQGDVRWCTRFCESDAECPSGFGCIEVGDARVCAPQNGILGASCEGNGDCITGLCGNIRGDQRCTRLCGATNPCPTGFVCERADGRNAVCIQAPEADDGSGGGGGGGCTVSGGASSQGAALLGWLMLAVLWSTRRRRQQ